MLIDSDTILGQIIGAIQCKDCAAGNYQGEIGNSTCVACSGGEYSGAGASICTQCDDGKYSPLTDSHLSCTLCPRGTYSVRVAAAAGSGLTDRGVTACTPCAIGIPYAYIISLLSYDWMGG